MASDAPPRRWFSLARPPVVLPRISPVAATAAFFLYLFHWGAGWGLTNWSLAVWRSLLVLGVLCGVWWTGRRSRAWSPTPLDRLLLPSGVVLLLSALASPERLTTAIVGWWFLGCSVLLYLLVHDLLVDRRLTIGQLADGLLLGASVPVLHGLITVAFEGGRAQALLENPNHYGGLMLVVLPLAVSRFRDESMPRSLPFAGLALAAFVGLCLSGSRGALLGLMGMLWFAPRRVRSTGLVLAIPVLMAAIWWRWETVAARLPVYQFAWEGICARPLLGNGLFTFRLWLPQHSEAFLHAHNAALHVAYEVGLVGLAVFLVNAVVLAQASRRAGPPSRRGWQAALLGVSLHQLVDVTWLFPMMFVVLPVLLAAATVRCDDEPRRDSGRFAMLLVMAWGLLIGVGFASGGIPPEFFSTQGLQI